MPPPTQTIDALARKRRYRAWADGAVLLALLAFLAVYARLADGVALQRLATLPQAEASPAGELATGTRLAALPQAENGTPVLATDEEPPPAPADEPQNDLQRRVAKIRAAMPDAVPGRDIDDLTYVSLGDAARLINGEQRWDRGHKTGVLITDDGLLRLAADTSKVWVNEQPGQIANPVRLVHNDPYVPLKALTQLYEAELEDDEEAGLTTVRANGQELPVLVPERLFSIEISRSERWLKVSYAGQLAKEYPICSGAGNNTPVGHFHIQSKAVWPSWRAYWGELIPGGSGRNPLGARWLGTTARGRVTGWAIGIHGTNQPSSIGRRISGGCIRTYNHNAIELYDTIPIGTRVWIHE